MKDTERKRLMIAIRHLERARKGLVAALGFPNGQQDHPVNAAEVALEAADRALAMPERYQRKAKR
jgi:hypothetical protein